MLFQSTVVRSSDYCGDFIRRSGWTENGRLFSVQNQRRR